MIRQNLFGLDNYLQVPCIPYMGSKRKLATRIINSIIDFKGQDFTHFYDLFGGGGAISFAANNLWDVEVHYNELNEAIFNLMNHIIAGGEIPTKWVTRDEFFESINGSSWMSGLIQSVWSFGNGQTSYIYGRDIQDMKLLGHRICVDKDPQALLEVEELTKYALKIDLNKSMNELRLQLKHQVQARLDYHKKERWPITEELEMFSQLDRLQHLNRINSLNRIKNEKNIKKITTTNKSYNQVSIKPRSIIYCDPPYIGTGEYKEGGFDHETFYKWCRETPHPVFISEYTMPEDFKCIASFNHKSTFSGTNNNKNVIEKLYWNGK